MTESSGLVGVSRRSIGSRIERRATRKSTTRWWALLLALALVAAACGSDGEDADAAPEAEETTTTEAEVEETTTTEAEPEETTTTEAPEPTSIRLVFVPATTGLLVNVASEQGFFAENNLDVELTPSANISEIIPTLGQQVDISLGTATDLIRANDSGLDVVQILGNTIDTEENSFVRVIVPADSGIEGVADLAGKRVSSPTLSGVIHVATLYWAQQEGIDPDSIEGVQVPPPATVEQFAAGQVDAAEALEPFASALVGQGNVSIGDPFASIGLPLATNFWVANGEWAANNPDAIAAFAASLEQAQAFVASNEADARAVLQGYTGMPDPVAANVSLPTFDLKIRTDDLARWVDVLISLNEFEGEIDVNDLVVSS